MSIGAQRCPPIGVLPCRLCRTVDSTGAQSCVFGQKLLCPVHDQVSQLDDSHELRVQLAAGGKLHTELMAVIELRHLIVDGAKQFLAENA